MINGCVLPSAARGWEFWRPRANFPILTGTMRSRASGRGAVAWMVPLEAVDARVAKRAPSRAPSVDVLHRPRNCVMPGSSCRVSSFGLIFRPVLPSRGRSLSRAFVPQCDRDNLCETAKTAVFKLWNESRTNRGRIADSPTVRVRSRPYVAAYYQSNTRSGSRIDSAFRAELEQRSAARAPQITASGHCSMRHGGGKAPTQIAWPAEHPCQTAWGPTRGRAPSGVCRQSGQARSRHHADR